MAGIDIVIPGRRTYDWILREAGELQYEIGLVQEHYHRTMGCELFG